MRINETITNAMIIDGKDTVAVAIEPVEAGSSITWKDKAGQIRQITAVTAVPIYHKVAIQDMAKGEPVVKYGEHIGLAAVPVCAGEHVHIHNVENHREVLY